MSIFQQSRGRCDNTYVQKHPSYSFASTRKPNRISNKLCHYANPVVVVYQFANPVYRIYLVNDQRFYVHVCYIKSTLKIIVPFSRVTTLLFACNFYSLRLFYLPNIFVSLFFMLLKIYLSQPFLMHIFLIQSTIYMKYKLSFKLLLIGMKVTYQARVSCQIPFSLALSYEYTGF